MKTKIINKSSSSKGMKDYISFFKFHHQKLMEMHPNWTNSQATVIIRLMWRKEKAQRKSGKMMRKASKANMKAKSGRVTFRMVKMQQGMNMQDIKKKWTRLPQESRKMWELKGKPEEMMMDKSEKKMKMTLSGDKEAGQLRQLMSKSMRQ